MISDEEIDAWYNSLSLRDKFNGWIHRCDNSWYCHDHTEEERAARKKSKDEEFRKNKRNYYNRVHGITGV